MNDNDPGAFDRAWERLLEAELPPLPQPMRSNDSDIDFHDDDSNIAGLATTFAMRRHLPVASIRLRASVDRAIEASAAIDPDGTEALRRYRNLMHDVAKALSQESGVAIDVW